MKTKVLISCTVTVQLICTFVFAVQDMAHILLYTFEQLEKSCIELMTGNISYYYGYIEDLTRVVISYEIF